MSRVSQPPIRSHRPQPPTTSKRVRCHCWCTDQLDCYLKLAPSLYIASHLILGSRSQWLPHFHILGACLNSFGSGQPDHSRDRATPTHSYASPVPVLATVTLKSPTTDILTSYHDPNKLELTPQLLPEPPAKQKKPPGVLQQLERPPSRKARRNQQPKKQSRSQRRRRPQSPSQRSPESEKHRLRLL